MMIPPLPSTAVPVAGRNDKGKAVAINSIGGALKNVTGIVISGPYTFSYRRNKEDKGVRRKGPIVYSVPYWQVLLDGWGGDKYLNFIESEIEFI